jgi:hypothetical protein
MATVNRRLARHDARIMSASLVGLTIHFRNCKLNAPM